MGKEQVCSCGCCCPDPEYYKCCAHCFFLLLFFCFPCCDYIIPCKCGLFNEQIKGIMLVKQQKYDTMLHKQHQAAKLAQKKAPIPIFSGYRCGLNVYDPNAHSVCCYAQCPAKRNEPARHHIRQAQTCLLFKTLDNQVCSYQVFL